MTEGKLQWHPAFSAALHIEFEEELDALIIEEEHLLGKKPLQVDVLVIKKNRNMPIRKNIGRIFREYNIIEYKAPDDYLSVNDFYKVYGYTCIYQADTAEVAKVSPEELTITYVCNHYPRELIRHLEKVRGISEEKKESGIYYLHGDAFPMQILVTKELSRKENYWLQNLRADLKPGEEIRQLIEKYEHRKYKAYYSDVMDLIVRANWKQMKEEKEMCEALRELFAEELEESKETGRREGMERGMELAKLVFKMHVAGTTIEEIAKKCGISRERVKEILE